MINSTFDIKAAGLPDFEIQKTFGELAAVCSADLNAPKLGVEYGNTPETP